MSVPPTPHQDGEFRSVHQLSKPFLSKDEILYCYNMQDVTTTDHNRTMYNVKKLEVINFLKKLIKLLKYPTNVLQLTLYYYQRFFMFNNFEVYKNSTFEIAITSLYISSKLQDYIKKLRDIVKIVNEIKPPFLNITESKILLVEKQLLQTINFDFRFQTSEDMIVRIGNHLNLGDELKYTSWLINNDTYFTDLHIRFPCNAVALACIQLACKLHHDDRVIDVREFKIFKDIFILESIEETLQFYMDNYSISFLSQKYEDQNKQEIMDLLITLKIDINKQILDANAKNKKQIYKYENDDYFKIDRNFNKNDNVRFVYQKLNYIDEL